jgi:hypothetical protein
VLRGLYRYFGYFLGMGPKYFILVVGLAQR